MPRHCQPRHFASPATPSPAPLAPPRCSAHMASARILLLWIALAGLLPLVRCQSGALQGGMALARTGRSTAETRALRSYRKLDGFYANGRVHVSGTRATGGLHRRWPTAHAYSLTQSARVHAGVRQPAGRGACRGRLGRVAVHCGAPARCRRFCLSTR